VESVDPSDYFTQYEEVVRRFLGTEATVAALDPIHELVRGLLYLSAPVESGDARAYKHAMTLVKESGMESSAAKADVLFFGAWASSCTNHFKVAHQYAEDGMRYFPDDPRFPYVKARIHILEL